MLRFSLKYFILTIVFFIIEVLIAIYVKDKFIRPYVGDVLVVILIYCFIMSFFKISPIKLAIAVLLFAFFVEWLQYMNFVKHIGLEHSKLANVVIGNSFEPLDLVAYFAGFMILLIFNSKKLHQAN